MKTSHTQKSTGIAKTPLTEGNAAFRRGDHVQAIAYYAEVMIQQPELAKSISVNLAMARQKYRDSRQTSSKPSVAVCGWDLAHNAAGRAYTLATIYDTFAQVEIIGSLFPSFGREVWEPIRDTAIAKHTFVVEDESKFIAQAIQLVAAHPYDIVHLSKPRAPNIFFGVLYKLFWGTKVLMDIDDEELAFVGADAPISIDDYIQQHGQLPEFKNLAGKDWTRLAVGVAKEFDGLTVCNVALQQRYGGEIVRHARDEKQFVPSPELKRKSREKYGIPQAAKVVLFFGTPREHKGLIETAQAIASLKRPDLIFCIVGSFIDESLKQQLLQVKECNYRFLPNKSIFETAGILSIADLCIFLQNADSTAAKYQTPAKISDAITMGITSIVSRVEGTADLANIPGIVYFDKKSPNEVLEEKIEKILQLDRGGSKLMTVNLFSLDSAKSAILKILSESKRKELNDNKKFPILLDKYLPYIKLINEKSVEHINQNKGHREVINIDDYKNKYSISDISLIIPVYNASDELDACLGSVLANIDGGMRVIIINDASTDDGVHRVLEKYSEISNFEIYHNGKNLGFSGTINRGIMLARKSDVIILNSDTKVTKGFHRRMMDVAYSENNVGTVTPLSNNAGPFTISSNTIDNYDESTLYSHSSALARNSRRHKIVIPTGHGFCMYIRRDCIDDVGLFDAEAFPRGYGEENDFCMRAVKSGWKHLLDDSTFIYHKKSASFKGETDQLIKAGREVLDKRYPMYTSLVRGFVKSKSLLDCLIDANSAFRDVDKSFDTEGLRILYVIPKLGAKGGTPQTNADLMRGMRRLGNTQTFLMVSDGQQINLYNLTDDSDILLETYQLSKPLTPLIHESDECDKKLVEWALRYEIDIFHYRHFALHSTSAPRKLKQIGVKLIFSFHDFYTICPTVKLLDSKNSYCGGVCTKNDDEVDCKVDVWRNSDIEKLRNEYIYNWNARIQNNLLSFDAYITTSNSAKELIQKRLPVTKKKLFSVIPHGRDFENFLQPINISNPPDILHVLVPGGINLAKGGGVIVELSRRLKGVVQFHVLGTLAKAVGKPDGVILHGEYNRDDFVSRVHSLSPRMHIGAIFSIWPETYCHTLTELWAAGLPVMGIDYGAVGERIAESGAGWICKPNNLDLLVDFFIDLKYSPKKINFANNKLLSWQEKSGINDNINSMAIKYGEVYKSLK